MQKVNFAYVLRYIYLYIKMTITFDASDRFQENKVFHTYSLDLCLPRPRLKASQG